MLEKYTVVIEQRKHWYGWRRGAGLWHCLNYEDAACLCTDKNHNNLYPNLRRYIVIPIDKV